MVCGTEISYLKDTELSWEVQCHVGEKVLWANLLLLCCTEMARLFLEIFISNTIALQRPYHKAIKSKETILIVMAFMSECFSRGIRHLNKILHAIFVDLDLGLLNLFSNYSFTENTWHET